MWNHSQKNSEFTNRRTSSTLGSSRPIWSTWRRCFPVKWEIFCSFLVNNISRKLMFIPYYSPKRNNIFHQTRCLLVVPVNRLTMLLVWKISSWFFSILITNPDEMETGPTMPKSCDTKRKEIVKGFGSVKPCAFWHATSSQQSGWSR
jgi:hypothetical protein